MYRRASPYLLGAILLCHALPARGQELRELLGRPIARVRYDPPVPGRDAERDTGLRPGVRIGRALIRSTIERLWRSRRFRRVNVLLEPAEARGVEVIVETRPLLRAVRLAVVGEDALSRAEIERLLGFRSAQEIWPEDLPDLEAAVERGYADHGYRACRATARLLPRDEPNEVVLQVTVREGPPIRVSRLVLDGDVGLPAWRVRDALDLSAGDVYDEVRLRERMEAALVLYREEGFRAARFGDPVAEDRADGTVRVRVPIHAGDRFDFAFAGNRSLGPGPLFAALVLDEQHVLDGPALEEARSRLARFYRLHGFLNAEVRIHERTETRKRRRYRVVTFRIEEGRQMRVVSLVFRGARHFDQDFLREQVWSYVEEEVPAPGVFQPIDPAALDRLGVSGGVGSDIPSERRRPPLRVEARTVYEEEVYARALEHIAELYKAAGYLGVVLGSPALTFDRERIAVSVDVVEGVQTRVSEVAFEGNRTVASGSLLEIADISRGAPLSYQDVEEARTRLVERLQDEGLYYVGVEPEIDFSETRERARIRYVIDEGPLVRITRIAVRGNERTSTALILDRLSFDPGDPFRPSRVRRSQDRLMALGVFRAVTIEPEAKDLPESDKAVIVSVVEQLPQYMELRGGFSTGQGARGGFGYGYRNLFGYALAFHFRVDLGYQVFFFDQQAQENFDRLPLRKQLERRISAGLTLPHTPGLGVVSSGVELALVRENERDFGYDKTSYVLTFSTTAVRRLAPVLDLGVEQNDFEYFQGHDLAELLERNPQFRRILRAPQGETSIGLVRPSVSYDLRDNPFSPTSGVFASLGTEYVQSFAQEVFRSEFVKVSTLLSGYVPLEGGVVLAVSGRLGRIFHVESESQTYPDRRFYLGGFDTVRGFLEDTMIPQDLAEQARAEPELRELALPGGDAFVTARSELRFPLGQGFQGGLFLDAGNLWANPKSLFEPFVLRTSAGAGIRYSTPVGPLAFDYGVNLRPRAYLDESVGAFHFSIGVF